MVSTRQKANDNSRSQEQLEARGDPSLPPREVSFSDLGPIGKTIAGCTEIVFTTIFDYCSGYLQGFVIGTLVGSPGFLFRTSTPGARLPFMDELSNRFARLNARSLKWGKTIGGISAAFGGFGVAVKVLRNGEQDVWNDICSSAAAGAFFCEKRRTTSYVTWSATLWWNDISHFRQQEQANSRVHGKASCRVLAHF